MAQFLISTFQLHLPRIAQQSEGNVFTRRNYLCARRKEGTDVNLKFIWAITGTEELAQSNSVKDSSQWMRVK